MKKEMHKEIIVFTYDTKEERDEHVKKMEEDGWEATGQVSRLKPNISIYDAGKENSREWYAEFHKNNVLVKYQTVQFVAEDQVIEREVPVFDTDEILSWSMDTLYRPHFLFTVDESLVSFIQGATMNCRFHRGNISDALKPSFHRHLMSTIDDSYAGYVFIDNKLDIPALTCINLIDEGYNIAFLKNGLLTK